MHRLPSLAAAVLAFVAGPLHAAPPVVSNIRAAQLAGTKNVEILYDVSDADGGTLTIGVEMSGDGGATYTIPATALSGQVGQGVTPGANRRIVWNAGADWNNQSVPNARARVTAFDGTTPVPPAGMAYIPAGAFQMGDNFNENGADGLPVHNVTLNGFFADRFEVTKELWQSVQAWGQGNGYTNIYPGEYAANGHPVQRISWYDAVKWCNARSEKDGLTPCYYTDNAQTVVYRNQGSQGQTDITNAMVKWSANGYRLPTEAEWEKAARGGSFGLRYPWGNSIAGNQANYSGSGDSFEGQSTGTTPVGYYNGNQFPGGVNMANGYGLYDIAGNVWEWCWDWYNSAYYANAGANSNPHGPTTGTNRVRRGGAWPDAAPTSPNLRCAYRYSDGPSTSGSFGYIGFRCVRGL